MIQDLWYKNAVIYSLDVDTFMDQNGDGIGDFEGLMRRLDYLHALGISTLWLAPFQKTPNRDNGYDIADYYTVDPRNGSSGDFVEFMNRANKLGMSVIIDLVVNHTSDEHRWFQTGRANKETKYYNYYVWSKKRPKDWNQGMVFPGVQKATWTRDPVAREYYYHRFYQFQPDLNIDNPDVRTEIRRVMGFWLQLGVAGFRVDAVPFVIESRLPGKPVRMRFDYLTEFRKFLQWRSKDAILLGEANVPPPEHLKYFGDDGDGLHMMFNFFVNQHLFYALASGNAQALARALLKTQKLPGFSQWAHFLRNHDELDLGRLTDEQRAKVFARFGPDKDMQLYGRGIRRRLAPMLGSVPLIELAYSLLFALPGTPVLRYGDEIGMGDDLDLPEREAVRTPMHWSEDPQAGFSLHQKTVNPVISQGPFACSQVNVAAQRRDQNSLFNWTARMIRLRKECPEIGWGEWKILKTGSPSVLAMRYDWMGSSLVTLHNLSDQPQEVRIHPGVEESQVLVNLLDINESRAGDNGIHRITLESYGYRWYRAGSLNQVLRQRKV
ncbi:maltose alpha-D-glucosyltransferase/alpha-amylase [Chthoniobacter flavus]|uniref:alpha-amylase family protein n=1 Tax=Chthoniobacter flavus TaxID=191863 RepID=UPI00104BE633|nr:alpha-amylase family protein [Chthoniobacter flavus]TCO94635.1 maltose alpha-D-glucosyltransferase/alpha-amylase [Chthoniobacter flavus]